MFGEKMRILMHLNLTWIFALALFGLVGCAKPNYQDPVTINQPVAAPEQGKPDTTGKFQLESQKLSLRLLMSWEVLPTESKMGTLLLEFSDLGKSWVKADMEITPKIILWMPSMGHGSSPVRMEKVSDGVFRGLNVFFVMPGEWEIRIQIKNSFGETDEVVQKISI